MRLRQKRGGGERQRDHPSSPLEAPADAVTHVSQIAGDAGRQALLVEFAESQQQGGFILDVDLWRGAKGSPLQVREGKKRAGRLSDLGSRFPPSTWTPPAEQLKGQLTHRGTILFNLIRSKALLWFPPHPQRR